VLIRSQETEKRPRGRPKKTAKHVGRPRKIVTTDDTLAASPKVSV